MLSTTHTRRIFLDVGAHEGQTLEEVLRPVYRFDVIHCFEPQSECYELLTRKFSDRTAAPQIVLHNFGLADFDGEQNLYGDGLGASLFSDKCDIDNRLTHKCRFVSASAFFDEHINSNDLVIMKLNCEGGELLILRDLIASGKIHLVTDVMIDFDILKIPSQKHEQANLISELQNAGFSRYSLRKTTMIAIPHHDFLITHQRNIRWWLSNLDEAGEFMHLTAAQKAMRILPFAVRRFIQKNIKRSLWRRYNRVRRYIIKKN